jgi:deoxycytidine triphosphate deaminase
MILSKEKILEEIKRGNIIAENCNLEKQVTTESIDVTLGEWVYYVSYYCTNNRLSAVHPEPVGVWHNLKERPLELSLQTFVLAHTDEFIGAKVGSSLHTQFHLGSTPARLGLFHPVSGYGDEGFFNRWALELINFTPITLHYRDVIGQISFSRKEGSSDYVKEGGHYQGKSEVQSLMKGWKREDIMPRAKLKNIK